LISVSTKTKHVPGGNLVVVGHGPATGSPKALDTTEVEVDEVPWILQYGNTDAATDTAKLLFVATNLPFLLAGLDLLLRCHSAPLFLAILGSFVASSLFHGTQVNTSCPPALVQKFLVLDYVCATVSLAAVLKCGWELGLHGIPLAALLAGPASVGCLVGSVTVSLPRGRRSSCALPRGCCSAHPGHHALSF